MGDVDPDADAEYADMPKFAVSHEGWLLVKIGMLNRSKIAARIVVLPACICLSCRSLLMQALIPNAGRRSSIFH